MRYIIFVLCSFMMISCFADKPPAFQLNTNAFLDEGILPVLYTCDGKDVSPEFEWTNVPNKTVTFALIITDLNVEKGPFYHWVLYNIPKTVTKLMEGVKPSGDLNIGKNSFGKQQYNGPCPPKGSLHTYAISLYALDTKLALGDGADGNTIIQAMKKHVVGEANLKMIYNRWLT